jgi:chorismate mutase/prephenate dehydrogenase
VASLTKNADEIRTKIEEIDKKILKLIQKRGEAAALMGQIKASKMLPLRVPSVEEVVMERYASKAMKTGMSEKSLVDIARLLIKESVEIQSRIPRPSASKNILVIGGAGNMGRWMCDYFSSRGHDVSVFDIKNNDTDILSASIKADVIVISSPIETIAEIADRVLSSKTKALIFDIASIKSPFLELFQNEAKKGVSICSVHPMFGPGVNGIIAKNVILCDCGNTSAVDEAEKLFEGANITKMDLEKHDELMAYVLGLSHALNITFNLTLMKSNIAFDVLSGVSSTTFKAQSELSIDVAYDNADLYYTIQTANPYNTMAISHLKSSIDELRMSDREEFLNFMFDSKKYFSENR